MRRNECWPNPGSLRALGLALGAACLVLAHTASGQSADPLPLLGMNVDGTEDWGRMYLFADAMKQSREWGSPTTPWDLAAPVDTDGWPTADAGVVVLSGGTHLGGTYHLSFIGKASVASLDPCGKIERLVFDPATNASTADLIVDDTARHIKLSFTDTRGGVRNVRLMRPGFADEMFTREYLDLIAPYACLRLNSYGATNGAFTSTTGLRVSNWSDRNLPSHATQNRRFQGIRAGASWEYAVLLANLTDKDLWVCVPDLATDDYVIQFATLLSDSLEPDRKIYVEWSNELWNLTFEQTHRNLDQAVAEVNAGGSLLADDGSKNQTFWAWRRVGRRIREISDIFRSVFGDAAMMTRVRPVLAMQSAVPESVRQPLEFIEKHYGPPSQFLYGIAEAPYFILSKEDNARTDLTVDQIFSLLPVSLARNRAYVTAWTSWAKYYGLKHLAYEGGPDLVGSASLAAKIAANRDLRMGTLIEKHLQNFFEAGGDQFEFFTGTGAYSQFSMTGITEDIAVRDTAKTRALSRVLAAGRPSPNVGCLVPGTEVAANVIQRDACLVFGSDPAGGRFVTSNTAGCWGNYLLRVPCTGDYCITVRVGSANAVGRLDVLADSRLVQCVGIPNSGSKVSWRDVPAGSVRLEAGLHVIRLRFAVPGFGIKSLSISQ